MIEANVDAIVGPTHHFGGLGVGNLASMVHRNQPSNPRDAALAGLNKAALVSRFGIPQFFWLPPERPQLSFLAALGFHGSLADQLKAAYETAPHILSAAYSSSFMWAANSATVSPSCDTQDGNLHVTPANLVSSWHRGMEALERVVDFRHQFAGVRQLIIHEPLPSLMPIRDEGAANHMRLCNRSGEIGCNVFVFGEDREQESPSRFMPRQTRAACEAIARRHGLDPAQTFYLRQHPQAISAGVFHNDVIATSHRDLLIHHEFAFLDAQPELDRLTRRFLEQTGQPLRRIEISSAELPLEDAMRSYFFNSQILSPTDTKHFGETVLLCPAQCQSISTARALVARLLSDPQVAIDAAHFVSLDESMAGGGGPACLRLRLPLRAGELERLDSRHRLTEESLERLTGAIEQHYPTCVEFQDLATAEFAHLVQHARQRLVAAVLS
ncbi:MAG: N-succinylarginine dihydrolase [Pirellulaceae bacterium]